MTGPSRLEEGWYLMSVPELESLLRRRRENLPTEPSVFVRLDNDQALAYRNSGNVPDEQGRTLRLVLHVDGEPLASKRLRYEPDFHDAPSWRRAGSRPVNVVPLAPTAARSQEQLPWWEHADVEELERTWERTGTIGGINVPADYRSFVLKTVASLHAAGKEVTLDTVVDSVARWLQGPDLERLRVALIEANRD